MVRTAWSLMTGLTSRWKIVLLFTWIIGTRRGHSSGPIFIKEPPSVLYLVDSSRGVLLTCSGEGNPRPSIQWLDQNRQPITRIPGYREILSNGSLYLLPFSEKTDYHPEIHSGTYFCSLTNQAGAIISRESRIISDDSLPYKLQVSGTFVVRGNTALLKCIQHSSAPRELFQLLWIKEDLQSSNRVILEEDGKYAVSAEGDLLIKDATDSDGKAKYYCEITNKLTGKSVKSQDGQLLMTDAEENLAPKIENTSPSEVVVKVGEEVDLFCLAKGVPTPTYKWYREVGNLLQEIRTSSMLINVQDSLLHFPKVLQSDSSNYVCVASNSLGEDRKKFKLSVTSEIIVFVRPQKQIVDSGSMASFNCSTHGGRGLLSITWLKNGSPLSLSSKIEVQTNGENLLIRSVDRNDRGMYQCFVRGGDESAQNSAELILGAVSPELKFVFADQTLQPGVSLSLKCVATGNPAPRILWFLDGGLLYPQGDYVLGSYMDNEDDVVSHLNISTTRVEHGGLYSCTARNILGSVQHSALLNVHGPPVSRPMMNLTVESGINVYLRCPASGYPISSTTWQYGGKHLLSETRHRVFGNGTLLIRQVVSVKDQGEYTCTIRNQNEQSAVGRLFLTVMEPPDVQPFQFDSDLKEGNRAHVSCAIKSGDLPMEFTWRKDGRALPPDPDVQQQNLQFVSNLLFSRLSARHAGHYTCIVSNIVAVANYTAHLRIKVSPVWTIEPMDTAVKFGQFAVLNCQASGFPTPSITWLRSADKEKTSFTEIETRNDILLVNNGSLIIQSAERHHEGYYQCNAKNDIGRALTKTIFIKINVPARFRIKSVNQSGIAGDNMVLTCEAEGDQPLKVNWNSAPVGPIQTRQTSTGLVSELHLKYLSRSYAGTYLCSATNSFGYDYMSIHLSVKELPEMPQNFDVTDIESRALKFSWDEVPGPVTYYLLQYREENTQPWQNATVNGDTLSVRVHSLQPSVTYFVKLLAVNELGFSEPSKLLTVTTLEEAPSGPPTNLEVNSEENTFMVQWQPPHNENANGALLGYEIEFRETGRSSTAQRKTVKVPRTSIRLTGLKYFTSYEVSVKAFNKVGVGPSTLPVQQITMESVPSQAPQKIKCTAESSENLRIQWIAPPHDFHNGNIQGYKIFYKLANPDIAFLGMKNVNKIKKTIGLEQSLTNLEKYTNYSIRVLAYTRVGDGARSLPIYCHTAEDLPEAPADIKALVMTSDSILVAWNPPPKSNGIILKYHVYIEYPERKLHKEVVYGEQKHLKHTYRNLREGISYTFWVVASTSVGEGPPSNKVVQKPASRVPAKISTFSGKLITKIGTRISLDCSAVGLPSPNRVWHAPHSSSLFNHKTNDQIIWLGPVTEKEAGNYSCEADNVYGKDTITFHLIILLPPPAPLFLSSPGVSSSTNSIVVTWRQINTAPIGTGGSPIIGFLLSHAAKDSQNWENVELEPEIEQYEIKELRCGTEYQMYVQAISPVGYSEPSETLIIRTKGTIPDIAKQYDIMLVNSTSVTLYLDNWPPGECAVQYFKVFYRNSSNWINVEPSRLAPESVIIGGLSPATKYTLRIIAINEAGSSKHDYVFATLTESGGVLPIEQMIESESSVFSQVNIIIPIVSAVLCVIAISACVFIIFRKKKIYEGYKSGQQTLETSQLDHDTCNQSNLNQRSYMPSPIAKENLMNTLHKDNKSIADYDVCPYATFSLPTQTVSHCVKLRSFNQHDCYENSTIMEGHHSIPKRPKLNHIKCPSDDFNVEIACISNQQTLPIGGKPRPRAPAPVSFTSDSDSSTGKFNQRRYQQMQRDIRQSSRDYDSSTESIETSPTIGRKVMGSRSFMR